MIHLGDITKISGNTAPIVDCIIGGSPCQDLSVAGKRAGLDGERSGLYIDQVRIAKEMRERDKRNGRAGVYIRPRYMVWENVPGAFSSNKGEDFRIVLEELAKVADKDAVIPPPHKGKWTSCGCIVGDGWSIAWRVLDAQFWGVPQRRRRIALVADFGGQSAPEILFVRESVSGHSDESKPKGKGTASHAEGSPVADHREGRADVAYTFSKRKRAQSNTDYETWQESCTANTLNAFDIGDVRTTELILFEPRSQDGVPRIHGRKCPTLNTAQVGQRQPCVVYSLQGSMIGRADKNGPQGDGVNEDVSFTINTIDRHAVVYEDPPRYIVRRLTPLECERLQGFPDGWTDIGEWVDSNGKKHQTSDAARYKALGNSIALPPWKWVLKRLCACYERDATMASLFDGIGGFPYLWEQLNGKGTCLWASEIEEFPIAVTKVRIGG